MYSLFEHYGVILNYNSWNDVLNLVGANWEKTAD